MGGGFLGHPQCPYCTFSHPTGRVRVQYYSIVSRLNLMNIDDQGILPLCDDTVCPLPVSLVCKGYISLVFLRDGATTGFENRLGIREALQHV